MYVSASVPEELRHLATFFYQMKREVMPPEHPGELLMPSGTGILAFQTHGRYDVEAWPFYKGALPKSYFIGQQTISYRLRVQKTNADIFGVAIRPSTLWKLTGIPAYRFTNQPTDPKSIFDTKFHLLLDRVSESTHFESRCEAASSFLASALRDHLEGKTLVDYALELIFGKKGCLSTRLLCKELHVSERHLQHLFRQQVGVSPLQYARITRFNAIFVEFTQSETPRDLAFLTSFYNYYDASHFFKDFKAFSGEAPSQFHLEKFSLLKELVERVPYLTQVQYPQSK